MLLSISKKWARMALLLALTTGFVACNEKDDFENENKDDESFVLSMAIQGSDGSFTYYTVSFDDVMTGSLSAVGEGIEQLGYYTYNQFGSIVYGTGGLGITNLVAIEKDEVGTLQETVGTTNFKNSLADLVKVDEENLVGVELSWTSDVVKLHRIDATSQTVRASTETPVSELTELISPAYSGMVVSGDYVFLSYYIMDPNTFATEHTDKAEVAIFSYPELEFIKVIEDDRTGPIGGFGTSSGLLKDEQGNVYALSHSNLANGFSQSTKKGGILRINSGETSFDNDYLYDVEELSGGKQTAHLKYLGNGKVFTEINTVVREEQAAWSDSPLQPAVLDLYNEKLNYIEGVPAHSGTGRKLTATSLQDGTDVYLTVPEDNSLFVYKVDIETFTATKGAEIQANFVAGFYKF